MREGYSIQCLSVQAKNLHLNVVFQPSPVFVLKQFVP